jgi:hypothetical protein
MQKLAIIAVLSWLVLNAQASVVVSNLNPPRPIYPGDGPTAYTPFDVDFNGDGIVDYRFLPLSDGVNTYIYSSSRVVIRYAPPPNIGGLVGALPLNVMVGEPDPFPGYVWWTGGALPSPLHEQYGDKLIRLFTLLTFFPGDLYVGGDFTNKNAAIGVEFLIGTNKHYGYIQFDCRAENGFLKGGGGFIRGWAYETEPDQPILTQPIAEPELPTHCSIIPMGGGAFDIQWRSTVDGDYLVKGSATPQGPYEVVDEVVASKDSSVSTVFPPTGSSSYFWRVVRAR